MIDIKTLQMQCIIDEMFEDCKNLEDANKLYDTLMTMVERSMDETLDFFESGLEDEQND